LLLRVCVLLSLRTASANGVRKEGGGGEGRRNMPCRRTTPSTPRLVSPDRSPGPPSTPAAVPRRWPSGSCGVPADHSVIQWPLQHETRR
jgi:hypothetical protein